MSRLAGSRRREGAYLQIVALIALTGALVAIVGLPKSTNDATTTAPAGPAPAEPSGAVSVQGSTTLIRPDQ